MNRHEIHNSISYYSLLLLSVALPTYTGIVNLSIFLLIANWLFEGRFKQKLQLFRERPLIWLILLYFLLHIVSMLYTIDQREGWSIIEKKLLIFVFPLIIGTSSWDLDRSKFTNILVAFALSCFAVSLCCLGVGVSKYLTLHTTDYLFHEALLEPTGAQPIYYGMYICFAAVILFWRLIHADLKATSRLLYIGVIVFFILFTVLLSARLSLAILFMISAVGGYIYSKKIKVLKLFWGLVVLTVIAGVIVVIKIPFLYDRVMELASTNVIYNRAENNATGLSMRLVKWECSFQGFLTQPIIGLGIGDTQEYLQTCYIKRDFWGDVYRYNSHNQFFQTAIGLGIIGLASIFAWLGYESKMAWNRRDYVHVLFIAIVCLCFMTESVLERKQGIVFVSLFSALLSFYPTHKTR